MESDRHQLAHLEQHGGEHDYFEEGAQSLIVVRGVDEADAVARKRRLLPTQSRHKAQLHELAQTFEVEVEGRVRPHVHTVGSHLENVSEYL